MTGTTVVNRTRFWIMAVRPKTLSASAAPVLIGAGLAGYHAVFKLIPVLATLVCAILIQIGTNLANDYYDFLHEAATEPYREPEISILCIPGKANPNHERYLKKLATSYWLLVTSY